MIPRWGSKPRCIDRLVVGRNVTLTLNESAVRESPADEDVKTETEESTLLGAVT
jgi:hypothetical protein